MRPVYYDNEGKFHIERRLGCIGCPLASDNGVGDYLKYPKLLKQVVKSAQIYLDNHRNTKAYSAMNGSAYNLVYKRLFCTTMDDYYTQITGGLFPENAVDTKQFLEDYFQIDL